MGVGLNELVRRGEGRVKGEEAEDEELGPERRRCDEEEEEGEGEPESLRVQEKGATHDEVGMVGCMRALYSVNFSLVRTVDVCYSVRDASETATKAQAAGAAPG